MRIRRLPSRSRRYAAATGSIALAGVLTISALPTVESTVAQQSDDEYATVSISAEWPEAFASVVAGSVKSSDTAKNGGFFGANDITYESVNQWTQQVQTAPSSTIYSSGIPSSNEKAIRDNIQVYQGVGQSLNMNSAAPFPNLDPYNMALHNWGAMADFDSPPTLFNPRTPPSSQGCLVINETYGPASNDARCGLGSNFAAASNTTKAFGFSMAAGYGAADPTIAFLNGADLRTSAKCGLDSATAIEPTGRVDVGLEQGATNPYLSYSTLYENRVRTAWSSDERMTNGFTLASGQISDLWNIGATSESTHLKVMPIVRSESRNDPPYAISEISVYVEVYTSSNLEDLGLKMYMVLSRSECGVQPAGTEIMPAQQSVFPVTMPGGNGLSRYTDTSYTPSKLSGQTISERSGNSNDKLTLPNKTDVTDALDITAESSVSNIESATDHSSAVPSSTSRAASVVTRPSSSPAQAASATSVIPQTSGSTPPTSQSTTTTSEAPAIVIPDEPGTLASNARLDDVETITVGEEELDVVAVKGDELPSDAKRGAQALEIWLSGGNAGTAWKTFASEDADDDGWRWAAINQKTGTVVYIR